MVYTLHYTHLQVELPYIFFISTNVLLNMAAFLAELIVEKNKTDTHAGLGKKGVEVSAQITFAYECIHGLRTPREETAFTARPKIQSQSQIFRYGGSIFRLPHPPNFSDIFDLCLHWVSVVHAVKHCWALSTNCLSKSLLTAPINVLPLHFKPNFPPSCL